MGKLDGKVVVVTGASRGIGAEIARQFAADGGKVVCAARTLREGDHPLAGSLEGTVAEIREAGGEATAVAVNISEPPECERLVEEARKAYGPIDVLSELIARTGKPCVLGLPIGHGAVNQPVPLGARVRIDTASARLEFLDGLVA